MTGVHARDDSWRSLRVVPGAATRDAVIATLFAHGAGGVEESGDAVVTHFPPGTDIDVVRAAVLAADPAAVVEEGTTPATDWSAWRASVTAHTIDAVTVAPPWLAGELEPGTIGVVIDPAMAFGTGEHATTRGALRMLQRYIRPGDLVADLGAGSAVLAIAAAKLGARAVAAIELDPDAAATAEENIQRNGVADRVTFVTGDAAVILPLVAPVRLVLANIVSSVLLAMLPVLAGALAPDGIAILGGILGEERDVVSAALASGGWRETGEDEEDGWVTLAVARG